MVNIGQRSLSLLNAVRQYAGPNRNPRDGAMLWAIQKSASGRCGAAPVASPGMLGQEVSRQFSLSEDSQLTAPEYQ
ncbi:hypothetical protein [Mitsuaria sp. GD03876]|uniref:hypothetical protein n=1 Tax=Mitsuaria sp. GD03876 TaxID=2975399 RepID=UPI00244973D7|nr:hypothetical protein [Mitsuaria sp. GD03876]MDH0864303.1 hypothetical protein [Mitsuaria sp. GD03876]